MERQQGIVARLVTDKGFGFVRGQDGVERFFHHSSVQYGDFRSMREGQSVTFEAVAGPKGPRAEGVQPV